MSMNKSSKIALALACIGIVWMLSGVFISSTPGQADEKASRPVKSVTVTEISPQPYEKTLSLRGRTQASRQVMLKAEVAGTIQDVAAARGSRLESGEVIATIAPRDRQALVAERRARVEELTARLRTVEALYERGFRGQTQLIEAQANLKQAQAALEQALIDLDNLTIRAPFSALLQDRFVEKGDYVAVGDSLANVVDLDPIYVVVEVSESDLGDLFLGQEAFVETVTGQVKRGLLHYIAPSSNEQTRTFRVEITLENPGFGIPSGITTLAKIPLGQMQAYAISPASLSLADNGSLGIKVVDTDNRVKFIDITIVADKADGIWITGPSSRQRLISVGHEYVKAGETVNPVEENRPDARAY